MIHHILVVTWRLEVGLDNMSETWDLGHVWTGPWTGHKLITCSSFGSFSRTHILFVAHNTVATWVNLQADTNPKIMSSSSSKVMDRNPR